MDRKTLREGGNFENNSSLIQAIVYHASVSDEIDPTTSCANNYHLDLVPVVWNLADHFNLTRVLIDDPGEEITALHSIWMLLSSDPDLLNVPEITERSSPMENYKTNIRIWTDDYSNLFQILK